MRSVRSRHKTRASAPFSGRSADSRHSRIDACDSPWRRCATWGLVAYLCDHSLSTCPCCSQATCVGVPSLRECSTPSRMLRSSGALVCYGSIIRGPIWRHRATGAASCPRVAGARAARFHPLERWVPSCLYVLPGREASAGWRLQENAPANLQ